MTDAPSGSGSGSAGVRKSLGKTKATAGEGGADGKKRFEVKKVRQYVPIDWGSVKTDINFSGALWHFGHGILSSTTVPFAETISWIFVSEDTFNIQNLGY